MTPRLHGEALCPLITQRQSDWKALISKLEVVEEEFVQGRPTAFKELWSRSNDVTLCGGFGGVERGWQNVTTRLDWVSAKYSEGRRTRQEITCAVSTDFAHLVQSKRFVAGGPTLRRS